MKSAIIYKSCTLNRAETIVFCIIKHAILRQERQTPHRAPTWSAVCVKDKRFIIYGHSRVLFLNICVKYKQHREIVFEHKHP